LEAAAVAIALLLTFSRAAAPPVIAIVAVWIVARWYMPHWLVPATLAAVLLLTVLPAVVDDRWLGILPDHSSIERLSAQVTGLHMFIDYPLLGVGPGSVASLVDQYLYVIEGHRNVDFSRLYSFMLSVIVTTGMVGTVVFGAYLLEVGRRVFHAFAALTSVTMHALALSCMLTYFCVVIYWIGSPAYNMSYLWFALAFGSALAPRSDAAGHEWSESV
jgi:O-antigen ligase